jgi:hypothetical protein
MTAIDLFSLGGQQDDPDAELFALFAEYDQMMKRHCDLVAESEKREQALPMPQARVEIGRTITPDKNEPVYAKTVKDITTWFDPKPNKALETLLTVLDIQYVLYRERRAELVADLQAQETAIAERRRAAGIDELDAQADDYSERSEEVLDKAAAFRPVTIRGVIEMLKRSDEYAHGDMFDNALAALRDIADRARLP